MTEQNGKVRLKVGHRTAKWRGKTWKSKFYIEDRIAIKNYAQSKLVKTLQLCLEKKRDAVEVPKMAPRRIRLKSGLWAAALFAAILLTAGTLYNYNYLNEGYDVLRNQGPKAALEFFQTRGENFENLFGQAFAAYRSGNYTLADQLSKRVLKSPKLEDQARAWYLLGDLKTITGEYKEAGEFLLNAHSIYDAIDKQDSLYRTRLVLVKLFLAQRDFYYSEYYITLAENFAAHESDPYFYYLKAQQAFLKNNYKAALAFALESAKVFNGDRSSLASILSEIGFYYGLTGQLKESARYTNQANKIAMDQEDEKSLIYNKVNMCLYLKCSNQDYEQHRLQIMDYARRKKDIKLMEQMYFVDKFTCPLELTGTGDIPPPDRNHPDLRIPSWFGEGEPLPEKPKFRINPGESDPQDRNEN